MEGELKFLHANIGFFSLGKNRLVIEVLPKANICSILVSIKLL